jgi:hypothetical protein
LTETCLLVPSVSTHLAEITGKKTYSDAASLSTNFLQHHMLTTENGVLQSLDVGNCTLNTLEQKSIAAATAYAFSVVADMTKDQSQLQLWVPVFSHRVLSHLISYQPSADPIPYS